MNTANKLILVADDEESLVVGVKAILSRDGYRVIVATDGAEALQMAHEHHPDLILCDMMMPPPNGMEVRQRLSEDPETAGIPFIFLTARASLDDKIQGLENGADDYITKPFDRKELLARIQSVFRREEIARQKTLKEVERDTERLKQEISHNLQHELRTPLSIVLQTLEFAMEEKFAADPEEQRQFLAQAMGGAQRLRRLVEDLIFLGKMDQPSQGFWRRQVDPQFGIQAIVTECATRAGRLADLHLTISPQAVVCAPDVEFRLVLDHLVDNACKFSPAGTPVVFRVDPNGLGGCVITVTDVGPGIPPELREKVFERYYQGSQGITRKYGGLGVGLTIARVFARQLGGDVVILDTPRGCSVQLTLAPGQGIWPPDYVKP